MRVLTCRVAGLSAVVMAPLLSTWMLLNVGEESVGQDHQTQNAQEAYGD